MAARVQMVTAHAVHDPRIDKVLGIFPDADAAALFCAAVQARGDDPRSLLRVYPWDVPGEVFEFEE